MADHDLNLLVALDALLETQSVSVAARRLGLSASAMSRQLSRLREATGDQLLVQAGRKLVPTTYGTELRRQVPQRLRDALALLAPVNRDFDPATLERNFYIRANEIFVEMLTPAIVAAVTQSAPNVCLQFLPKPDKDAQPHRSGQIDLEIGVIGTFAPELRTRLLFRDRAIGVCRKGHPLLVSEGPTIERYAASDHVVMSRRAGRKALIDEALEDRGLTRRIVAVVPTFSNAMQIARRSDLVALVTRGSLGNRFIGNRLAELELESFELPVETPDLPISAIWHPRLDADPAHVWLREKISKICCEAYP